MCEAGLFHACSGVRKEGKVSVAVTECNTLRRKPRNETPTRARHGPAIQEAHTSARDMTAMQKQWVVCVGYNKVACCQAASQQSNPSVQHATVGRLVLLSSRYNEQKRGHTHLPFLQSTDTLAALARQLFRHTEGLTGTVKKKFFKNGCLSLSLFSDSRCKRKSDQAS